MGKLFVPERIQRIGLLGQRSHASHYCTVRAHPGSFAGRHSHLLGLLYRFLALFAPLVLMASSHFSHLFHFNDDIGRNVITHKPVCIGSKLFDCQIPPKLHKPRARRSGARSIVPSSSVGPAYHIRKVKPDRPQSPPPLCHDPLGATVGTISTDTKVSIPAFVVFGRYPKRCRLKGMTTMMTPVVPVIRKRIPSFVSDWTSENGNGGYLGVWRFDGSVIVVKIFNVRVGKNSISLVSDSSKFAGLKNHVREVKINSLAREHGFKFLPFLIVQGRH